MVEYKDMNNKYWFFGSKLNTVLLLILIILMIVALRFMYKNNETYMPYLSEDQEMEIPENPILGNRDDLVFLSIVPNTKVSGVLNLEGEVKGGYFFEGNILVNILDKDKNILREEHGTATTDWMTVEPVSFTAKIDLSGLEKGTAYLEIKQDDPSGGESGKPIKSILIPIIIN